MHLLPRSAIEMHRNDHDIVPVGSMHNPQHPAAKFGNRLEGSRALRVLRVGFDKVR